MNTEVQEKFFAEVNKELQKVEGFFRGEYVIHGYNSACIAEDVNNYCCLIAQEAKAKHKFSELKRNATAHQEGLLEPHRQWNHILRHGGNAKVLRMAFSEFYLNLILLQNYQVCIYNTIAMYSELVILLFHIYRN